MLSGQLILKSGEKFFGKVAQPGTFFGEVVFNTGMVGYVESLTDPSYAGQILVFTYPLQGNYGVSDQSYWESQKIFVKGVIMSSLIEEYSHYTAQISLLEWLKQQNIPFMTDVDTRAITKRLRNYGVMTGAITDQTEVKSFPDYLDHEYLQDISLANPIEYGTGKKLIIAIDCGMKENILRNLLQFPVRVKRVPFDYDFTTEPYDGIFISNGPGDPKAYQKTIENIAQAQQLNKPIFGICLGTQLMALASGAKTYKLPFGHRSQNQPCLELKTQRAFLTAQNHGYAIDENSLTNDWEITFRNLNDYTVAGIAHKERPFFSVQFHPESAPGPLDTIWLFQKFYDLL